MEVKMNPTEILNWVKAFENELQKIADQEYQPEELGWIKEMLQKLDDYEYSIFVAFVWQFVFTGLRKTGMENYMEAFIGFVLAFVTRVEFQEKEIRPENLKVNEIWEIGKRMQHMFYKFSDMHSLLQSFIKALIDLQRPYRLLVTSFAFTCLNPEITSVEILDGLKRFFKLANQFGKLN